jgi:hypothetical protein
MTELKTGKPNNQLLIDITLVGVMYPKLNLAWWKTHLNTQDGLTYTLNTLNGKSPTGIKYGGYFLEKWSNDVTPKPAAVSQSIPSNINCLIGM